MSFNLFPEKSVTRNRVPSSKLLEYAQESRNEGFFSDFTIKAGKLFIPANRMVLACHSRYFETMFKINMKEKYDTIVEIKEMNGAVVKSIVDYFYTGSIKISSDNVIDLLTTADYLHVDDVKEFCCEFLESLVSPNNVIRILHTTSELCQIEAFTTCMFQYITDHFDEVILTNDFKCLPKKELISNLTEGRITESLKYQAVISWIKHDHDRRRSEFPELFQTLVNVNQLPTHFIKETLLKEELIRDNFACYERVLVAFSDLLEEKSAAHSSTSMHTPCRQTKIISIGGYASRRKVFDVCKIESQDQATYPGLPEDIHSHCALKLNDFVYCIGGESGVAFVSKILYGVRRIGLKEHNSEWSEIAPLNVKRCSMGAALFQNKIVVAGGKSQWLETDSVEYYDALADNWTTIASLNHPRKNNALVACNGSLFALGGTTDKSVERLQDLDGEWQDVRPMQKPRLSLAAVSCNGMIYAIGGQTRWHHSTAMNTVERYDPTTNTWSYVKRMRSPRYAHSACAFNGKIVVVGGCDKKQCIVRNIECYDPANDTWSVLGTLNNALHRHSIVSV